MPLKQIIELPNAEIDITLRMPYYCLNGDDSKRAWDERWNGWKPGMLVNLLHDVFQERLFQEAKYGHVNNDLLDGSGPDARWLTPYSLDRAYLIQRKFRSDYERREAENGLPTWVDLIREEVAEAFEEDDPDKQVAELIQVAALCLSWAERIRTRQAQEYPDDPTGRLE